jgi:HSP20 family molecular chaperone IbpA
MTTIARRSPNSLGEILDWFDTTFPLRTDLAPAVRVEDYTEDGGYVLRAEIPGIDPDRDVSVLVHDGLLTIRGERREEQRDRQHHEFHYGAFSRTVTLPRGAQADQITANYTDGVLEVRVPSGQHDSSGITVPVQRGAAAPAPAAASPATESAADAEPLATSSSSGPDDRKDAGDARPTR